MTLSPRAEWSARLNSVPFCNCEKAARLLEELGPEALRRASVEDWSAASTLRLDAAERLRREALAFDLEGELRKVEAMGGRLLVKGEPGYPAALLDLPDSPLALYLLGSISDRTAAAVVGTRVPSAYGRRTARRLASELARRRVVVVSGLARGIDAEAHEGALEAKGLTWAVLGSGLGRVYPPDNRDLAREIVEKGGAVLTEYPHAVELDRTVFVRRNRIIAGLSAAVTVVEGTLRSGALDTAEHAARYGRELLAVPGPVDAVLSAAPHKLLKDGARLACRVEDIVAALPVGSAAAVPSGPVRRAAQPPLEGAEAQILTALGGESLSLDELARVTGLDMSRLSLIMFGLEIKDLVLTVPGQRYAKKTL